MQVTVMVICYTMTLLLISFIMLTPRGSKAVQTYTMKGIKCTKIHNKKHKTYKISYKSEK